MSTLTLFYDGNCPLCAQEMARAAARDRHGRLAFINIGAPDFAASPWYPLHGAMMRELHALDAQGQLMVGVPAIVAMYRAIGMAWLVWPLQLPGSQRLWGKVYRWFARNRYWFSSKFDMRCPDGVCDLRQRGF